VPGEAIRAELTVSLGWPKLGLVRHPARGRCGELVCVEIGFPPVGQAEPPAVGARAVTGRWIRELLVRREPDAHKGTAGYLALVSGQPGMAGASVLAARSAGRGGAGVVRVVGSPRNRTIVQTAGAYNQDMGITTPILPRESVADQPQHDGRDDDAEVTLRILEDVAIYVQTLAVPARRDVDDPTVRRGEEVFGEVGCAACHVPELRTGVRSDIPEASEQLIRPYTDLLLHDMGDDLADGRPDFEADGREWRTPPLWGVGLTRVVNGHAFLLHDGRARDLMEAILWHGGEAEASRDAVKALPKADRDALVRFLESL